MTFFSMSPCLVYSVGYCSQDIHKIGYILVQASPSLAFVCWAIFSALCSSSGLDVQGFFQCNLKIKYTSNPGFQLPMQWFNANVNVLCIFLFKIDSLELNLILGDYMNIFMQFSWLLSEIVCLLASMAWNGFPRGRLIYSYLQGQSFF